MKNSLGALLPKGKIWCWIFRRRSWERTKQGQETLRQGTKKGWSDQDTHRQDRKER